MQKIKYVKQPVAVAIVINESGKVLPLKFRWKDGKYYDIDKVICVERAASTKVGGCGIRYTVMVEGLPRFLFNEDGKWFMEDEIIIEVAE